MIKHLYSILFILFLINSFAFAQTDSLRLNSITPVYQKYDSAGRAARVAYRDSIKAIRDSLSLVWIKAPDPGRTNPFLDSLINLYKVENLDFSSWAAKFPKKNNHDNEGILKPRGETWIIIVIFFLVIFFSFIRFFFPAELNSIIMAFYSNQILTRINKEDSLFNSWPFVFFYLLFGLIIGLYLYLSGKYMQLSYPFDGFELFLLLSVLVIGLFTFKIIILRIVGFLFDAKRLVREYVSVLYLSYFNAAILFLPIVIAFSLTSSRYAGIFSYIGIVMLFGIFVVQFLRAGSNILSNYKFPKVYLIIYLCALEFCPLIILFKALGY
ncbi:MAG: DUF4271 domain-containing protein [Daejeonella sp.]|uniref:DUF4271 domain-containing protein n=1 Tax=Daejeonella sp. TaxID=2805397 RepID=UPI002735368B|nr:DUF4271 domain-containing protein [Daejeonella sp.]MDP3469286.1 DUF4271 domain-containing protein [Daejeonella sp.]